MKKLVVAMIMLVITFITLTFNNPLWAAGPPNANNIAFLPYNDTTYGISIMYPSNWEIDASGNEFLLSILQNLTSESQTTNDSQTSAIKSQRFSILEPCIKPMKSKNFTILLS